MEINSFDIDGVISIGIYPGPNDIIITGRSYEEKPETLAMLGRKGIFNQVFFNDLTFDQKSRKSSGIHKGNTLNYLREQGYTISTHIEDDEVQIEQIKIIAPWCKTIHVVQDLVSKENVRHLEDL